ncbi:MAG: GH3 auxin-responsive promoter, partial [Thermoanaerobaculia bacterium]
EAELAANPHYRACVALGQLAPARVRPIQGDGFARYARRCRERGQRLGDVKPLALSPIPGWAPFFLYNGEA